MGKKKTAALARAAMLDDFSGGDLDSTFLMTFCHSCWGKGDNTSGCKDRDDGAVIDGDWIEGSQ